MATPCTITHCAALVHVPVRLTPFKHRASALLSTSRTDHDGPMEQARGKASSRRRGKHGAFANKRAADARARALASTLRELKAAGFISRRALADELNRRGIPTARGGRWHYTTVVRMLTRLGLLTVRHRRQDQ